MKSLDHKYWLNADNWLWVGLYKATKPVPCTPVAGIIGIGVSPSSIVGTCGVGMLGNISCTITIALSITGLFSGSWFTPF